MRGADDEGHVANFVETEQALLHEDGRQTALVQIRGSIPLQWHSPVCLKYTPRVYFGDAAKGQAAAKKHVEELVEHYGPEGVVFVNLVNMKKDEQALGIRFKQAIDELADKALRYVWFDFHHECKKMKYGNLAKLLQEIEVEFGKHAFFARAADGTITQVQQGVVRTNCLDNLDRTNVVQSIIGRRSLLMQLGESKALALDGAHVLEAPFPSFEKVFKDVWGNNADAISVLYSGTGALKTDFTRTGKRTIRGALQDGVNSVMRFYKNNFVDATRQDALDLMLGRFRPDPANPSPFLHPPFVAFCLESLKKPDCIGPYPLRETPSEPLEDGVITGKIPMRGAFPELLSSSRRKDPQEIGCGTTMLGAAPWATPPRLGHFDTRIDDEYASEKARIGGEYAIKIRDKEHLAYFHVFEKLFGKTEEAEGEEKECAIKKVLQVPGKPRPNDDSCPACGYKLDTPTQTFCLTCGHYEEALRFRNQGEKAEAAAVAEGDEAEEETK